jgi:hypothetical protein
MTGGYPFQIKIFRRAIASTSYLLDEKMSSSCSLNLKKREATGRRPSKY